MRKLLNTVILTSGACLLGMLGLPAQAGVVVVVGSKSPASALTMEQAAQLFTGKAKTLPGAGDATLVDLTEGSAAREEFYTKVTGKNASQVKAIWARLVFSGAAQAPTAVGTAAEMKKVLGASPSAVGYLDSAELDASVKVIFKID